MNKIYSYVDINIFLLFLLNFINNKIKYLFKYINF